MEWISVKDRLPDDFKSVLFYTKFDAIMYGFLSDTCWYETYNGLHSDLESGVVTHWMPLPEPHKN